MSHTPATDFFLETAKGNRSGHLAFRSLGERDSIGNTATGEDLWQGAATTVPIPEQIGTADSIDIVSDDAADTLAGTGVRKVTIDYLDTNWTSQSITINMDGTSNVQVLTDDCRFIQRIYAKEVGSNNAAEGTITIYRRGDSSRIYAQIAIGGNMCLTINRMTPAGHTLYITNWHAGSSGSSRCAIRLRASAMDGVYTGADLNNPVFLFKGTSNLHNSSTHYKFSPPIKVPEKTFIKASVWTSNPGAYVSVGYGGVLVQNS